MMHKRILWIANSRTTRGGITSILNVWERMPLFHQIKHYWLETQVNSSLRWKLYYMLTSYIKGLFIVPFFSICHFHTVPGMSMAVQMPLFLWAKVWRKKVIVHLHVGNQLADYKDSRVTRFVLRHATRVVVLAEVWRRCLMDVFGVEATVIYNTIEMPPLRKRERERKILYAGYLTPNKGYDIVLEAFAKVARSHPEWTLLVVGTGELAKARALADELGVSGQTDFYGWATAEQMRAKYESCAIYCLASYKEGFPMSALEAWKYGIPMITTPVGGLVDVAKDGENVMLFGFGDASGLAVRLERMMGDRTLRERIARKAYEMAKAHFSLEEVERSLRRLYDGLYKD